MKKLLTNVIQLVCALLLLRVALAIFNQLLPEILIVGGIVGSILLIRAYLKHKKDWW